MHALVDLDILCYEMGSAKDTETGLPLAWPLVQSRIDERIDHILEVAEAGTWQGYLTGPGNFREQVATIKSYKGERKRDERPFWYEGVYRYLRDIRGAEVAQGIEADDAIACASGGDEVVLCSRDKDLLQLPGWHYQWPNWNEKNKSPIYVSELDGLRNFYSQLLTGDNVDNILGLYNVGPKSACVQRIRRYTTELEMFREVKEQYELRFGSYWDMFMCENGRLLWLLRHEDDDWYERQLKLAREAMS